MGLDAWFYGLGDRATSSFVKAFKSICSSDFTTASCSNWYFRKHHAMDNWLIKHGTKLPNNPDECLVTKKVCKDLLNLINRIQEAYEKNKENKLSREKLEILCFEEYPDSYHTEPYDSFFFDHDLPEEKKAIERILADHDFAKDDDYILYYETFA